MVSGLFSNQVYGSIFMYTLSLALNGTSCNGINSFKLDWDLDKLVGFATERKAEKDFSLIT